MAGSVERGDVPGVVTLVSQRGEVHVEHHPISHATVVAAQRVAGHHLRTGRPERSELDPQRLQQACWRDVSISLPLVRRIQ